MAILYRKAQEGMATGAGVPQGIHQATNKMKGVMNKPTKSFASTGNRVYSLNEAKQAATIPGGDQYNWEVNPTWDKAAVEYRDNFKNTTDPYQLASMMNKQFGVTASTLTQAPAHYGVNPDTNEIEHYLRPSNQLPNRKRFRDPNAPSFDFRTFQNLSDAGQIQYPDTYVKAGGTQLKNR